MKIPSEKFHAKLSRDRSQTQVINRTFLSADSPSNKSKDAFVEPEFARVPTRHIPSENSQARNARRQSPNEHCQRKQWACESSAYMKRRNQSEVSCERFALVPSPNECVNCVCGCTQEMGLARDFGSRHKNGVYANFAGIVKRKTQANQSKDPKRKLTHQTTRMEIRTFECRPCENPELLTAPQYV